jgi:hypothetical protein
MKTNKRKPLSPEAQAEWDVIVALSNKATRPKFQVVVTRFVGRKPRQDVYYFQCWKHSKRCRDWWFENRGGLIELHIARIEVLELYTKQALSAITHIGENYESKTNHPILD